MECGPTLAHYHAVHGGEEPPLYRRCRAVAVDFDPADTEARLRISHAAAVRDVHDARGPPVSPNLLDLKAELARRLLTPCRLCERHCKVDRAAGQVGFCRVRESRVATQFVHLGEERELVPSYTVFLSGCTFSCVFCQNWDISQSPETGRTIPPRLLARRLEAMASTAVRNVNWVGGEPTPNLPYILDVLRECDAALPQVWNSNMYLTAEALALLDGVVDLYLADFKYGPGRCSGLLSRVPRYWEVVSRCHREANRQTEILLRHLVMPGHVECCTRPVLEWVAVNLDASRLKVNVMDQYRPEYLAHRYPAIDRRPRVREILDALGLAEEFGLPLTT